MSIDLTTEISRIDEHDDKKEETSKVEDRKSTAATDEYDNTHVENSSVENMEPIASAIVEAEDGTESSSESIANIDDRAEMAMANDENAVAPDLSDAAMSPTESAAMPDLGEAAIAVNEDIPDAAPSEAIATPNLDETTVASGGTKVANEVPVNLDLDDDDAMKYDQKSMDKSAGEIAGSLHSSSEAVIDNEYAPTSSNMVIEAPTPATDITDLSSVTDSAKEVWQSLQANNAEFFEKAKSSVNHYFKTNSELFEWLGLSFLVVISIKLLFSALNAVDDIPLVSPLLKTIGLIYSIRFVWRYLLRERDRQELKQAIDRTKTEIFGS